MFLKKVIYVCVIFICILCLNYFIFSAPITDFVNIKVTDTNASFSWTPAVDANSVNIQHSLTGIYMFTNTEVLTDASFGTVQDLLPDTNYDFRLIIDYNGYIDYSNAIINLKTLTTEKAETNQVAENITSIENPLQNQTYLNLPENEGYTITIFSSSNTDVISTDNVITPPLEETTVSIVLKVLKEGTETFSNTTSIDVIVPMFFEESDLDIVKGQASSLIEENYSPKTWNVLQEALEMEEETENEVLQKIEAINNAINELIELDLLLFFENVGWHLISTDYFIDKNLSGWIGGDENINTIYKYDSNEGYLTTTIENIFPTDAIFVEIKEPVKLGFVYQEKEVFKTDSKFLEKGWNILSVHTQGNAEVLLNQIVRGNNEGLTTLIYDNIYNTPITMEGKILNPFKGYWVHINEDKEYILQLIYPDD